MKWNRFAALAPLAVAACTEGTGPTGPEAGVPAEPVSILAWPSKSWVRKYPMPAARANHVAVAVNGRVT